MIQEIKLYQQSPYKIQHSPRVTAYLLDATRFMADDELYRRSLMIEPRTARMSVDIPTGPAVVSAATAASATQPPSSAHTSTSNNNNSKPASGKDVKLQSQTSFPGWHLETGEFILYFSAPRFFLSPFRLFDL